MCFTFEQHRSGVSVLRPSDVARRAKERPVAGAAVRRFGQQHVMRHQRFSLRLLGPLASSHAKGHMSVA